MGKISEIAKTEKKQLSIDVFPYLMDHHHDGKVVMPAVEIMNVLAVSVISHHPLADTASIENARFDKFLFIPEETETISAVSELSVHINGNISAKLITKNRVKGLSISRMKDHAILTFSQNENKGASSSNYSKLIHSEPFFEVPVQKIYEELVPFGPSYHNLVGTLLMNKNGASATIRVTEKVINYDREDPIGSPFPLDAAFHAACVWGQRYQKIIAFPVGIRKRTVHHKTQPKDHYHVYVEPVKYENECFVFNILITNESGVLYESVTGVLMKDVSAGRLRPPAWIIA